MGSGNIPSSLPYFPHQWYLGSLLLLATQSSICAKRRIPCHHGWAQQGHPEESFASDVICWNWLFGLQGFCKHFQMLMHAVVCNSVIFQTKVARFFCKGVWETLGSGTAAFTWRFQDFPRTRCALFSGCTWEMWGLRTLADQGNPGGSPHVGQFPIPSRWGSPSHSATRLGPSGGRQPCGAVLSPISLRSRMTSFKAKVHCSNWIFSILRGVKINILLSLFTHKLESSKCDIWKELHDYNLKWEQRFILCGFLFFLHCRLWKRKGKNLNTIKAEESQGRVPQC